MQYVPIEKFQRGDTSRATFRMAQIRAEESGQGITKELVRAMFDYDEHTGELIWNLGRNRNNKAGYSDYPGKERITIRNAQYGLRRVIWLWMTGDLPEKVFKVNGHVGNIWANLCLKQTNACRIHLANVRYDPPIEPVYEPLPRIEFVKCGSGRLVTAMPCRAYDDGFPPPGRSALDGYTQKGCWEDGVGTNGIAFKSPPAVPSLPRVKFLERE